MITRNKWLGAVATLALLSALISACTPAAAPSATEAATQAAAPAATEASTQAAAPAATQATSQMGTKDNPIVFVFVPSGDSGKVLTAGTAITDKLTSLTGLVFKPEVPTSYAAAVEAMCGDKAQFGALNTFSYVLGAKKKCAQVTLVSIRNGSPTYTGQIITRADSGIKTIADLKGKTFCRPDPNSTSGWIMPSLLIKAAGLDPNKDLASIKDSGGHPAVVKAVYNKECDAGATFGDARSSVQSDLPDVNDKVVIIATTAAIPNDTVAAAPSVPADISAKVTQGLLDMTKDKDSLTLLTNLYGWTGLQKVDDTFYDPFRQFLQSAGVNIEDFVQ